MANSTENVTNSKASVNAEALDALQLLPEAEQLKALDYLKALAKFSKGNATD